MTQDNPDHRRLAPLCFSSLGCPDASIATLCQLAHDHHVSQVELRTLEGHTDYPSWLAAHPAALQTAQAAFTAAEVSVALIASSFNLTGHSSQDIDSLLDVCRVADSLNAPYVRLFGGGSEGNLMSAEQIRQAATLYRETSARCRNAGIRATLLVETHGGLVSSQSVAQFHHAVGEAVPLLWDTHHTWRIGGESPAEIYSRLAPCIRHFHCKDSLPTPDGHNPYTYVLPGQGHFPFREFFSLFADQPPRGALSLEWEKRWHPELPDLGIALAHWVKLSGR